MSQTSRKNNTSIRNTLAQAQATAAKHGGQCLAQELPNSSTPIQWRCAKGHVWKAKYSSIKSGRWCRICRLKMLSVEELQRTAAKRSGKFLSTKYINNTTKYRWQCKEGHIWQATASAVRNGAWCHYCAGQIITLKDTQHFVKTKGGICLSAEYINAKTRMRWQCKEGHTWEQTWDKVHQGHWCKRCAKRFPIDYVRQIAESYGGRFLSHIYTSARIKYEWECANRHRWQATVDYVKNEGRWCPTCRRSTHKKRSVTVKVRGLKMRT